MIKDFTVSHTPLETLPPFAWGAICHLDSRELEIFHGLGVEKSADGTRLVEGAWNGDFSNFDFCESTIFCGTGFCHANNELLFSGSSDCMSPIFSIKKGGKVYISNSAIFAMRIADARPLPHYPFYNHDVLRIFRQGLHNLAGETKLENGEILYIHVCAIIAITTDGDINYRTHPPGDAPDDFEHYRSILIEGIAEVLKNGQDSQRKSLLGSAAAISTGYDSTTVAALARDAGCTMTHTFYNTKAADPYIDSGVKNAASLGMECREYDRWAYLQSNYPVEAEFGFISSGGNATISVMKDDLRHKIYMVGSHGELPWGVSRIAYFAQLSGQWRRSVSNISQIEYRLKVGYIIFAPAVISLRHNLAIAKISEDKEMQRWSVKGSYNRPISRRICEEAGIPREQFGMKKFAGGHSNLRTIDSFSKAGYASYSTFLDQQRKEASSLKRFYWKGRFKITSFIYYELLSSKRKSVHSTPLRRKFPFILNAPPQRYPWQFAFIFQWAFNELKDRYKID